MSENLTSQTGDDSSDEESERKTFRENLDAVTTRCIKLSLANKVKVIVSNETKVDFKNSLLLLELGMRILISDKVGNLYFPLKKERMGYSFNLPDDEKLQAVLNSTLQKTIEFIKKKIICVNDVDEVLENLKRSDEYKKYLDNIKNNKILFLSSPWSDNDKYKSFFNSNKELKNAFITSMNNTIKQRVSDNTTVHSVKKRLLTNEINKLKEIPQFITATGKVSKALSIKSSEQILNLEKSNSPYKKAVFNAYVELKQSRTSKELLELSLTKLESKSVDFRSTIENHLNNMSNSLKKNLLRPVLPSTFVLSLDDVRPKSKYSSELLFCYSRLIHCSAKRYMKNIQQNKGKDGSPVLIRSWNFNTKKNVYGNETQKITDNFVLCSEACYPHESNYIFLLKKLSNLKAKCKVSNEFIVENVKSILKTGTLKYRANSKYFEQFLTTFTYHLFVVEVTRHPATLIYNILAFDILRNHDKLDDKDIKYFPMACKGAVDVVRTIHTFLKPHLSVKYNYDHRKVLSFLKSNWYEDKQFETFISCEQNLVEEWSKYKQVQKEYSSFGDVEFVKEVSELCKEYYGIELSAEDDGKLATNR